MYDSGPSEAELAAIGLKREDVEDTSIAEIWPENHLVFQIFARCGTQWNSGMGGPTGLNYPSVMTVCDILGVKQEEQLETLDAIQIMEREALKQMNKKD